jgi:hypothetical protein
MHAVYCLLLLFTGGGLGYKISLNNHVHVEMTIQIDKPLHKPINNQTYTAQDQLAFTVDSAELIPRARRPTLASASAAVVGVIVSLLDFLVELSARCPGLAGGREGGMSCTAHHAA